MARARVMEDRLLRATPPLVSWGLGFICLAIWSVAMLAGALLPAAGLVGAAITVVFAARPRWAAVAFLIATVTVVNPSDRIVPAGPVTLSTAEAVFLPGMMALGIRWLIQSSGRRALFTFPVLAYLGAAAVGLAVAIAFGDAPSEALTAFRAIVMLAGYWILREAYVGDSPALARALVVIAVLGSLVALAGSALGWDVGGQQIDYVITGDQVSDTTRLSSPVLRLLTVVLPMVFMGAVLVRRPVARWLLVLAPMIAAEAASLTRSAWAPLIAVCVALPATVTAGSKWLNLVSRTAGLVLVGVLGLAALAPLGMGSALAARLSSTVDAQTVAEDSLSDRLYEVRAATQTLRENPTMGIGLQQGYGAINRSYDPDTDTDTIEVRRWIHNSLLGVWLWMGLLGVASVLWLAFRVTATALSAHRAATEGAPHATGLTLITIADMHEARVALGAAGGLAALLLQSTFQTNLAYVPALVALAAGLAYLDVWSTTTHIEPPATIEFRSAPELPLADQVSKRNEGP